MSTVLCGICGKEGRPLHTVREAWLQAGGYGTIPPSAIVHPACDAKEQAALQAGRVKLSALYVKRATAS